MNNGDIGFNQDLFFDYANDIKNRNFFVKMMMENGINYSLSPGYCYGLANEYLLYMINNQGEEYIKQLNSLYDIANSHESGLTLLERVKYEALKKHAQVLLNEFMSDVIKVQSTYQKSVSSYNYFDNFEYGEINNDKLIDYLDRTIEVNFQSGKHSYGKDIVYYTYLYELQKIKLKKYAKALFSNEGFFETAEGKLILTDPLFIKLKEQLSARLSHLGKSYTVDDARFFINILNEDIQRDNYLKLESHNYRKGGGINTQLNNYAEHLVSHNSLNNFKKELMSRTQTSHDPILVKFCTPRHAMAISAIYDKNSKLWNYTFFDPNSGVTKFNNQDSFIGHLDFYVRMNAQQYGFKLLRNNDYEIKTFELKENNDFNGDKNIKKLSVKDIRVTENAILVDRKAIFTDNINGVEISYKSFSAERNIVKVKVIINKKSFYVYSNILDSSDLQDKIKSNTKTLLELKSDCFISDGKYNVYLLNKNVNMESFNVESIDEVLEKQGKKFNIGQIDTDLNYTSVNLKLTPLMGGASVPMIGIPKTHQDGINKVANKHNIIIGFRPVDIKSTSLINSGMYSSKGLAIKGKSADWGPHSGFIPIQQQYAKQSARIEFEKFNNYIQQSIEENKALAITLEITPERVNELISYKTISPLNKIKGGEYSKTTSMVDGQKAIFLLKKIKQGENYVWQVYYQDGDEIKPFQVIGDPKTGKAITADYDLFSVIFPISQLEDYIKVTEMPTWDEWKLGVVYDELNAKQKIAYDNEVEYNKLEGKDNGIINKKIKEIKNDINHQLGREDGFELVHHGADDANPTSMLKDNFPITFFLPDQLKGKNLLLGSTQSIDTYFSMNSNGAIIIQDVEQLSNFQQLLINQGYRAPVNRKWSEGGNAKYFDPKRKLSESYLIAYNEIQRKKSIIANSIDKDIENKLGKSSVQLDTDFENINVYDVPHHERFYLSGEQSESLKYIKDWHDPLMIYRDFESQSNGAISIRNTGEYDYNVIIQIAGDKTSAKAVAGAFSKHPDKSMIIQYDIISRQYHILHGDLERLNTGKIRWLTVGHGIYKGNNEPTSYMDYNAQRFVDGLDYLKTNILNNKRPDKLVLIGCNLGTGGINENFAIKAVNALAKYGMDMPTVAYNRSMTNNLAGVKYAIDNEHYLDIKKHKFIYQYHNDSKVITINDQPAVLYFINELRRGEIKLYQLIGNIEPDPMAVFRSPESKTLDFNLLRKVAYNPTAYQLFANELQQHNGKLPEGFYAEFSAKLNNANITAIPRWEMVDGQRISQLSATNKRSKTSNLAVIVRFIGDSKGRHLSETLAAKKPENTLIFQMDVNARKWILEYGDPEKLVLPAGEKSAKWILIGDSTVVDSANENVAAGLAAIKGKFPSVAPTDILFHTISSPETTSYTQHVKFTAELSSQLKLRGINVDIKSSNIKHAIVPNLPSGATFGTNVTLLNQTSRQQVRLLLEQIALKQMSISDIRLTEHPYLAQYFTDADGQFSKKRIQIALYDPLISPKVYEYLNSDTIENKANWDGLFDTKLTPSLQNQALDSQAILRAIHHDPHVLNSLSEQSIRQLKMLFPMTNEFDRGKLLVVISDSNAFTLIDDGLTAFSRLSSSNFIGENAPLKDLSLAQALQKYHTDLQLRQQQFNQLNNQASNHPEGSQINMIHHGWLRQNGHSTHFDQKLGLLFGLEFQVGGSASARDVIERKAELEQKQQQGILTESEIALLKQIQNYTTEIENNLIKSGVTVADQLILDIFSTRNADNHPKQNSLLLIKSKLATFTISCTLRDGLHEYSLFDPNGFQLSVKHAVPQHAKHAFYQLVKNYFSEEITLPDGKKISRGQHSGFNVEGDNQLRADIQYIDLDDVETYKSSQSHIAVRENITKHIDFAGAKNCWVSFNGEKISLMKLQNLGVTIDGKPINISYTQQPDWYKKARFNSEKLAVELTMMDGKDTDLALLKILRRQLSDPDNIKLMDGDASFTDNTILKKQLKYIAKNVDIDNPEFTPKIIESLHTAGARLSRFERFSNRFGQTMGGAGIMQSIVSIYTILSKLENPDLSEAEYAELEKQFYLTCGNAFFNYGDMVLQPILLKIATKYGASSLVRSRLASGTVVVFNLVGMGLDAYQAYECLSKLETTHDPKQRQDLIVNAFFTFVSMGVSAVTTIAVLASSATIPAIGLLASGLLILRSWVYSAKRHVDSIKSEIDISWSRELEEGIRGAIGLEPTERTQQEIMIKRYIDSFKKTDWRNDLAHFEQTLVQAGFDHHLSVVEKPIFNQAHRYYLVDDKGNYFGGTLGHVRRSMGVYHNMYTKRGAPSFTSEEADFLLNKYVLRANGIARRGERNGVVNNFRKELKAIFDLERTGSQPTNEYYGFNTDYHDPLFSQFKTRHGIQDNQFTLPTEQQLRASEPKQLSFYSTQTKFGVLGQMILNGSYQRHSEYLENNVPQISLYLDNPQSRGASFNTANGNDVIIGKKNQMNAFQVLSGEKYFAGGNKSDYFYLRDNNVDSLSSHDNKPTKYLDGQLGGDTLIIDNLPENYEVRVGLEHNEVRYYTKDKSRSLDVAHIKNIENIILRNNTDDAIQGDDNNNIIDGGLGIDALYGYGGADKLILTQGYANGGNGHDSYQIRRYKWSEHASDLYHVSRKFNNKTKTVENKSSINPIYRKSNKNYHAKVTIDEHTQSLSAINLEYSLNEISDIYVEGEHLYLQIQLPTSTIDGLPFPNITSQVTIELKNAYKKTSVGRELNHTYRLRTRDGFVLNSQLASLTQEQPAVVRGKLFNITYLQNNDQLPAQEQVGVYIDETKDEITVNNTRKYSSPIWGMLTPSGQAKNLIYKGSDSNNVLSHITSGSRIKVSLGNDVYQINQANYQDGEIVFDFSDVKGRYSEKDKVILLLQTKNGYSLQMDGQTLIGKARFGDTELAVRFENFGDDVRDAVFIQDKYRNLFSVSLQKAGYTIVPVKSVIESTDNNDFIELPVGYLSEQKAINGQLGNDIILDRSLTSRVLIGGAGDDTIKSTDGNNVLYGGSGVNFISGGDGNDFLLSSSGYDSLMGGAGDDHYLIDGKHVGLVYIDDNDGKNHIHLVNFNGKPTVEQLDDGTVYHYYLSEFGKIVKIKQKAIGEGTEPTVHTYSQLTEKYQSMIVDGMEPLANYFADKLLAAQMSGELATWQPADVLSDSLSGIPRQLRLTSENDGINLGPNYARTHWLIDAKEGNDSVIDQSLHGRIIKGGRGNDKLITFGGENVLCGGQGDDILHGGDGKDILISIDGKDILVGGKGNDFYLVSGQGKGDVTISDFEGRNRVMLTNFHPTNIKYEEISANLAQTTYQSKTGRLVIIRHNNHKMSMADVTDVRFYDSSKGMWNTHTEQTVDRLIQLLVEQRFEYENTFDDSSSPEHLKNAWGAVQYTESFLSHTR